ncbi:hypothetical protein D3C85_1441790 [compost metagenome]
MGDRRTGVGRGAFPAGIPADSSAHRSNPDELRRRPAAGSATPHAAADRPTGLASQRLPPGNRRNPRLHVHRPDRCVVRGNGHAVHGADLAVLLPAHRHSARYRLRTQRQASSSGASGTRRHADNSRLRLPGSRCHALRHRQRARRTGHHHLRPCPPGSPDRPGHSPGQA